jgi:hypothetical protein
VALTAAAVPLWVHLSLWDECRSRVERALSAVGAAAKPDARREMKLYAALGTALLYARRPLLESDVVWMKALRIAERLADSEFDRLERSGPLFARNLARRAGRCCGIAASPKRAQRAS